MEIQTAAYWKERLQLTGHVEGGFYKRTYCSSLVINKPDVNNEFPDKRNLSSAIYFLLEYGQFSAFHRIKSDEMWHFYSGHTLYLYEIKPDGKLHKHTLGNSFEDGERFQVIIPAGSWFASRVETKGAYALVGCTVTPAFEFRDFELANREQLIRSFPQHQTLIKEMTIATTRP